MLASLQCSQQVGDGTVPAIQRHTSATSISRWLGSSNNFSRSCRSAGPEPTSIACIATAQPRLAVLSSHRTSALRAFVDRVGTRGRTSRSETFATVSVNGENLHGFIFELSDFRPF
jgi:hypothetical protein